VQAIAESSQEQPRGRGPGRPFARGVSGNPGGRPKVVHEVRTLARAYAAEAIGRLVQLMRTAEDERVRLAAAEALLTRGFGRPEPAIVGPLVNVNVGLPQPGGRPLSPEECYRYVISGQLPREQERLLVDQLQEAARRPAREGEVLAVDTSAKSAEGPA